MGPRRGPREKKIIRVPPYDFSIFFANFVSKRGPQSEFGGSPADPSDGPDLSFSLLALILALVLALVSWLVHSLKIYRGGGPRPPPPEKFGWKKIYGWGEVRAPPPGGGSIFKSRFFGRFLEQT